MTNMAIKTLLVAGVATFGLCTGALAQTNSGAGSSSSGATTQGVAVGQGNAASQAALAFGGNQLQQQTLIQGRALANVGVQLQNAVQTNIANNIAVQTNVAIPIVIKTR
jgi:hypothetical protein